MTKYAGNDLTLSIDGTSIGQCRSIGKVGATIQQIDASVYGDDWTDTIGGLKDGAEVAIVLALDPADSGQTALRAAWDGVSHDFVLGHPATGYQEEFPALVLSVLTGGERDGLLEMETTLKIVNPGVTEGS